MNRGYIAEYYREQRKHLRIFKKSADTSQSIIEHGDTKLITVKIRGYIAEYSIE
jgi:hypothetical protein